MSQRGLFVGLVTLDLVYLVETLPRPNQKVVALDSTIAAGGPAANAAVTFQHLGNQALLLSALGSHPLSHLIGADLQQWGVTIADLATEQSAPPSTSSILVTRATGDRAVVSLNATRIQAASERIPPDILQNTAIVLLDGHQMQVAQSIAQSAKAQQIAVVIDGGSWKPGFERVLPWVDYAVCSANFYPPGCDSAADVFAYLSNFGISDIAITQGHQPIQYRSGGKSGEVPVLQITPVDTLGAGDVFHGAFCHAILNMGFCEALAAAAIVAAQSCQFFGTRSWMTSSLG
jgi:sugar/nucleoside kinase (ribokinase family)